MASAHHVARRAKTATKRGASNSWLEFLERAGYVVRGVLYGAMGTFALGLALGLGGTATDQPGSLVILTGGPIGKVLLFAVVIGIVAIVVGLGQFVDAYRAILKKDLKRTKMNKPEKKIADALGRLGLVSRGVIFTVVGWFVLQGGLHRDPSQVHGYGGAFLLLLAQPYGRVLLAAVAVGFIALGLHSLACARWIRLLGSDR